MFRSALLLASAKPKGQSVVPTSSKKGKQSGIKLAVEIEDIVFPPASEKVVIKKVSGEGKQKQLKVTPPLQYERNELEQRRFVEKTMEQLRLERYNQKKAELERMYAAMKRANLELEQSDPELFKKAQVRVHGEYFPLERRQLCDTPPVIRWNSENLLSTSIIKKE